MFDVGFFELLLIGVVALLVVGPERLPKVARTAGAGEPGGETVHDDAGGQARHVEPVARPVDADVLRALQVPGTARNRIVLVCGKGVDRDGVV